MQVCGWFCAVDFGYAGRCCFEAGDETAAAGADVEDYTAGLGEEGRDERCGADEGGGGVWDGRDLFPEFTEGFAAEVGRWTVVLAESLEEEKGVGFDCEVEENAGFDETEDEWGKEVENGHLGELLG